MCLRVGAVKSVYKITLFFFFFSFSSLALRDFTSDIRKKKTVRELLWSWQQNTNCLDLFVLLCVASVGRQSNHSEVPSTINYSISELALMSLFLDFHFSFLISFICYVSSSERVGWPESSLLYCCLYSHFTVLVVFPDLYFVFYLPLFSVLANLL